jgi:predicted transcriptional regulator
MEIHFSADVEARLSRLAAETGRAKEELVEDAMAGYFDEVSRVRGMLDNRFDELKSGTVTPIPGEEVLARLREKSADRRSPRS